MNTWLDLAAFSGILALGQFSPGPDMLLLTQTSLSHGRKAGWLASAGIATGLVVHGTVAIAGMAVVLAQGGGVTLAVKVAAALYLGWLGAGLIRHAIVRMSSKDKGDHRGRTLWGANWYLKGLFCNLLNPKAALFFAGVVTPFLKGDRPDWWPVLLGVVLVAQSLLLWGLWVQLLQNPRIRRGYARAALWIDLAFGLGLLTLALLLVVG